MPPPYGYAPPGYPPYGYGYGYGWPAGPLAPPMLFIPRMRRRNHPVFPGIGWAFLALGVGIAVLQFGGIALQLIVARSDLAKGSLEEATKINLRAWLTPHQLFSLVIVPLLVVGWRCKIRQTLSIRLPKLPLLLLMIPLGVFLQVLLGSFLQWFITLLPQDVQAEQIRQFRQMFLCENGTQWVLTVMAISVSPGIFEELLFRGILQNGLQVSPLGRTGALMVTAGLFAVVHLSPVSIVPLFIVGLLLGYIAMQTGTIWYGVLLHATFNFTAIWFANVSLAGAQAPVGGLSAQWPMPMLFAAIVVLLMCAAPLWIWTRPRPASVIAGEAVDSDLEINLAGPAPAPPAQLARRPRLGLTATAAICLLSLSISAACFFLTWTHFKS